MRFDGTVLEEQRRPVEVAALASTLVAPVALKSFEAKEVFAVLTLEQEGRTIASNTAYFAKPRELALPLGKIAQSVRADKTGFVVELRSPVLARAVALSFGDLEARPDDNYFDLLPNESRQIHVVSKAPLQQLQASLAIRSLADATL
jgi:beta-mannosidase